MKYKALIFDLDGTLLDTLDDLTAAVNYAMTTFGLPIRSRAEVQSFVGNGVRVLMSLAVPQGPQHPQFEDIFKAFTTYYEAHTQVYTRPYDNIINTIQWCREQGYLLGIVSNKLDGPVKNLADYYFKGLFQVAIGESPRIRRKPAPDALWEALRLLNVQSHDALFIGDSEVDIETARNADVKCLSVTWGFRDLSVLKSHGATAWIDQPEQLKQYL